MREVKALPWLFFCLLGLLFAGPAPVRSQDKEITLERILNPLPDYDPFDRPPPTPKYFPDAVDKHAREALLDSITDRKEALQDHVRFFLNQDRELRRERGSVTGLTEGVLDLLNNTIRDRTAYLEGQKNALAVSSSPQQKQLIEARLRNDELTQADELLRKSAANRWGAVLNRFLSSMDLLTLLTGSYAGAAADSTVSQLVAAASTEMPIEERRALALYLEHLRKYPNEPQNGEIRKRVEALEKKKRNILAQRQTEKAEEAMPKSGPAQALWHYEVAASMDPASREVEDRLEGLKRLMRQQEKARKIGLAVEAGQRGVPKSEDEEQASSKLLYALALRDGDEIERQARALEEKHRGKPLGESAKDALAVAREIKGQHEEAKGILQQLAGSPIAPHERKRAGLLLESPEYNLLASFHEARSQRRLETVKYVLLGEDLLKKNLLYGTAPLIFSGPAGAASLGAANVIMIGTNLFQVLTSNPVSYQNVIDKGVEYIRNHPQSESANEVYSVLAAAYEEAGMYDRAIAYHEMSGNANPQKIADLKEKAAKALVQAAERTEERGARQVYLKAVIEHYAETAAAKQATQRLAGLAKIENQGLRLSKKFLMENPELYGPNGLGLKPTLFDGNLSNMELADRGINILGDGEILLHFQTQWGVQSQTYQLRKESRDRLQIALRKKNYDLALADIDSRPKGSPGGLKGLPMPALRGDPERQEGHTTETTFTLVQEATGSSGGYSKVLDYQLVSENEKDPNTKFTLPPIQGNISASGFDIRGSLPTGLWGNRLILGGDEKSPFAGVQTPIPLLQGFIPVDFLLQGRPAGRLSIFPRIHLSQDKGVDQELYR